MSELLTYLVEYNKTIDEIVELSTYQILFESDENEKVASISKNNEKVLDKAQNIFSKAIQAIKNLFKKISTTVHNLMDYFKLSPDDKKAYNAFREKIKQDPDLANRKVTVKVYQDIRKTWGTAINNVEREYVKYKDSLNENHTSVFKSILNKASDDAKFVTKTVTLSAVCKMIDDNESIARSINTALATDSEAIEKLENIYGKKGAKQIKDHAYVKTSSKLGSLKLGVRGLILKARQKEAECVEDSLKSLFGSIKGIGGIWRAAGAVDSEKRKTVWKTAKDLAIDSYKMGAKQPLKAVRKARKEEKKYNKKLSEYDRKIKNAEASNNEKKANSLKQQKENYINNYNNPKTKKDPNMIDTDDIENITSYFTPRSKSKSTNESYNEVIDELEFDILEESIILKEESVLYHDFINEVNLIV